VTYQQRKASGACVTCDSPRGGDGTTIRCRDCATYTNEQSARGKRTRRVRKPARVPRDRAQVRLTRRAAGLCVAGGPDHAARPGATMCAHHAEHRCRRARARYATVTP
jgi:hypothetical protein